MYFLIAPVTGRTGRRAACLYFVYLEVQNVSPAGLQIPKPSTFGRLPINLPLEQLDCAIVTNFLAFMRV